MNKYPRQLLAFTLSLFPMVLLAQTTLHNPTPGGGATLKDFICLLIEIVQAVGIPLLVCFMIYAGYLFLTAKDNEAQISKAKVLAFSTFIGAVIILGAAVIANMVFDTAQTFDGTLGGGSC